MAYSDSFPAIRPSFQFNADAGRLDPRISYSRSTTGTYFGTDKVLSSENLLLQSQDFDTTWTSFGLNSSTPLTGSQTAPDGTSTAWQLNANTGVTDAPLVKQQPTLAASTAYTASVHVKAGTATHAYVSIRGAASHYAYAQIEFASPGSVSTGGTGFTGISGTVTALGSSWYRISVTCTTSSSVSTPRVYVGLSDGSAFTTSGYPTFTTGGETLLVWGAQLNTTGATVYDSPTTTQIAREYQTKLQTAAINAPRFEHSASDSASMGLLIEGSSTNLYPYGSDQYNWSGARRLVQSNAAISPAGTLTADLVTLNDEDANTHYVFQYISVTSGTTYTISQYVKAAGLNYVVLRPNTGFASNLVTFDLSNGTIVSNAGGLGASIEPVGNEWYRISVTATANATVTNATCALYFSESSSTTVTATGDSYRGVLLWGAQCEASSFASSLVDTGTSGSTVTRAADSASMDLTQAGFNGGPFTVVSETEGGRGVYPQSFNLTDGTSSNQISVYRNSAAATTTTNWYLYVASDGSNQVLANIPASNTAGKLAVSLNTNDAAFTTVGNSVTTDTSVTIPSGLSQLKIGATWTGGANHLNGHVKRLAVFGEALSDTNLISLTK